MCSTLVQSEPHHLFPMFRCTLCTLQPISTVSLNSKYVKNVHPRKLHFAMELKLKREAGTVRD